MTTRVISTSYGSAALSALRDVVAAAKQADAMSTVTIIVPNNIAGIVARRHLAHGLSDGHVGVAALHISTLPRLAERLAAHTLAPKRPATRPVVAAAWRQALAADPGAFAEVAEHPATVKALAQAHRELRDLSPERLAGNLGDDSDHAFTRSTARRSHALDPQRPLRRDRPARSGDHAGHHNS